MKLIHQLTVLAGMVLLLPVKTFSQADTKTTEIWLVDVVNKEGKLVFGNPQKITDNDYYDNQPCFSREGKFLYYSSMPDTVQADIYEYDVKKKTTRKLTNTPESEYQPQPIPFDKNLLSVVRVDTDKAQRFYSVNMDGTEFSYLAENEDSVAYYTWMNDTTVGMYKLNGQGGTLEQFDMIPLQSIILMTGGFGRCLQKVPQSPDLAFVTKPESGDWKIMRYKMETEERMLVGPTLPGEEDYCWTTYNSLLMGSKGKLYIYDINQGDSGKWEEVADYTKTIGSFYRLAFSPMGDKLAIVSYRGVKP